MVEEDGSNSSFNHLDEASECSTKTEDPCDSEDDMVDYKSKYRQLKRKLKCLLYEQESFHEELRKIQRKCLRVNRDKSFLLDRLLQYEQPVLSSDDENTSSSDEEVEQVKKMNAAKNKNKSSKSQPAKSSLNIAKVRCRRVENGKQCPKLVSVRVKSGICYAHRQQLSAQKQGSSSKSSNAKISPKVKSEKHSTKQCGGGKDIGQIREAMEANARMESSSPGIYGEEDDDLVIDLPH